MRSEDKTANVVASILLHQLDVMEHNESGVTNNIDSEFLHDFRIAVRRTRSALGQIKGVFDDEVLAKYKKEFAWLGAMTTPARDLDVMLLEFKKYQSMLPKKQSHDQSGCSCRGPSAAAAGFGSRDILLPIPHAAVRRLVTVASRNRVSRIERMAGGAFRPPFHRGRKGRGAQRQGDACWHGPLRRVNLIAES